LARKARLLLAARAWRRVAPRYIPESMNAAPLPTLDELGQDLLRVTRWQRSWAIARPLLCLSGYFIFAVRGWWIPAVLCVAGLMFITYVSTSHDLLHRTLGFSSATTDRLLALIEALVLRSGHAFRITHLQHHRRFPAEDDIEGAVARLPWWRALPAGVGHQTRQFAWAWRRASPRERRWLIAEVAWTIGVMTASVALLPFTRVLFVYVLLVVTSSWVYPFATVWVPHRAEGEGPLFQTAAVRGRIVPEIFLQHTYHLEHHLYPAVPSFNWPELARRLDPFLRARGVQPIVTP